MNSCGNNALAEPSIERSGSGSIQRIRFRAPKEHGQVLQLPPLDQADAILALNLARSDGYDLRLQQIRNLARKEVPELALTYSQQYCDVAKSAEFASRPIVMSGHQPTLFHSGVWYKNFLLSELGQRLDATAVNLVVDNDVCSDVSVAVPDRKNGSATTLKRIHFDAPAAQLPFENRRLVDSELFESFGKRLASAVHPFVPSPLVEPLWHEVLSVKENAGSLGAGSPRVRASGAKALYQAILPNALFPGSLIAAGRHRLENQHGVRTIELPVSWLARTRSFCEFSAVVLSDAARMAPIHNESLAQYRSVNRIRSRSHPVPELETVDGWTEVPFWGWTPENPMRRRLFARVKGGKVELSDLDEVTISFTEADLASQLLEVQENGNLAIRPRALMTTMFSRLFASDLFIHGIGGAKYDQLNDQIMRRFWGVEPPCYFTSTATMKLPIEFEKVRPESIVETREAIRKMHFYPERYLDSAAVDAEAQSIIAEKHELLRNPIVGHGKKAWHDQIQQLNERLRARLSDQRNELRGRIAKLQRLLPESRLLDSREFSFALFPDSIIEELKSLCRQRDGDKS